MDGALIDAAVAAGAKGVVIVGVGNGNMTEAALNTLAKTGEAASRACAPRPAASAATSRRRRQPRSMADLQRIFDEY